MTLMEFFLELITILAWPVTVLVLVAWFREPLLELLSALKTIRYGDFQAEFQDEVDELRREADEALPARESSGAKSERWTRLEQLACVSPNAAVLSAFALMEQTARELVKAAGHESNHDGNTPYLWVQNQLSDQQLVNNRQVKIFQDLRRLRNKVAHSDRELSPEQAAAYVSLAEDLAAHFSQRASRLEPASG